MISLAHVQKWFGNRLAVESLDLEVPRGSIFGLLGHNGAGKSTAIGMMLGQVWPSGGEIRICGFDITQRRAQALGNVGAIFESPVFYDYLSGWRNLEILSHYTRRTSKERIKEVIDWVGLTGRERSPVRTYSHGMRARLALAQALLPQPELLILDEPSDGLDPEGIHEMRHTVLRLHRELGLTILLSSHLLNEVEQICSHIAVLNKGIKVFDGPLAGAKSSNAWIKLVVDQFDAAADFLRAASLITDSRDGSFIALAPDISTAEIVRRLVQAGFALSEITRPEQTLEQFYLSLMKNSTSLAASKP